jgi:AraC-like DNA-binding protein
MAYKNESRLKNKTDIYMHQALPGMAVLQASFMQQQFSKHWHETFSIGVILSGVNRFWHRGTYQYASRGNICIVNPEEVHTGETIIEKGWSYLNIFPSQELFVSAQSSLELPTKTIYFPSSVINDIQSAKALQDLAIAIKQSALTMEVEQLWLIACQMLFARHIESTKEPKTILLLPRQVRLAREILDSNLNENFSLSQLAEICKVSPFHLARGFASHLGLPPHAYRLQRKIEHAKALIQKGETIAQAATAAGFVDQAHLSRHFRKHLGVPPGQFRVRNNSKKVQYDL